jgi:quinoprotein glucose dehydrogenase
MRNRLSPLPIIAVLLAGCASNATSTAPAAPSPPVAAPAPVAPAPAAPASRPAAPVRPTPPVQTSAPDDLPPGPGHDQVARACGGCHGVGQILPEHRSRAEWSDTVTTMITNGAPVADADFDTIVTYLATHFGPR